MHSLKGYASSKVLLVIFNCDHRPIASMYEKRIKQLTSDYTNRGVSVVVIMGNDPQAIHLGKKGHIGDSLPEMKLRAAYRHFNYPYLYDGDTQAVALKYGPPATPYAFVFDQQRILRYEGRIDNNPREELVTKHKVRNAIDALLAGQPVKIQDTPAVACSTKWAYKETGANAEIAEGDQKPVTVEMVDAGQLTALRKNAGTDKLLLVNFWATWCGPCTEEFPELQKMVRMYAKRQLQIVTVSINNADEKKFVMAFLQEQHAINRNLLLSGTDSAEPVKAFGTDWKGGVPYTVLIGMNGDVLYKTQGGMNALDVRRAILKNLPDDRYIGASTLIGTAFSRAAGQRSSNFIIVDMKRRVLSKMFTLRATRSLTTLCKRHGAKSFQFLLLSGSLLVAQMLSAQTPPRPRITGISHIAIFAHDYQKSRAFYGQLLGFEDPYSLQNPDGTASMTFFKINDRQVIELFPERQAGTDRLNHISLETDDIEALRVYLASKGVKVPAQPNRARIGNLSFNITDPEGHTVEMVQYMPEGKTMLAKGKFMSDKAISNRMTHVGLIVTHLDSEYRFYTDILGFKETWRGSKSGQVLSWVNLKVPDGDDYIEFMLYKDPPAPTERGGAHHLCLQVPDVDAAVAKLKANPYYKEYGRPIEIHLGVNRKRQANLFDPDGTRTEVMEPNTIDGKPTPPSTAPPPQ